MFLKVLRKILKNEKGINASDLVFYTKPPVSLLGAINPTDYISLEEGREIFHLPKLSEKELEKLKEEKHPKKEEPKEEGKEEGKEESTDKKEEDGTNN
jgi:hypothetical protein